MSTKFVFDEAGVEALEAGGKEWRAWDEELEGFGVAVWPSGKKSWIVSAKETGKDGKARSRRRTIGRLPDMSLDEARTAARKILGEAVGDGVEKAAPEEGPDSPQQDPAAEATAEPDPAADSPPNEASEEAEPGAGVEAETTAAAELSADEEYDLEPGEELDPETGEVFSTDSGAGAEHSHDEDLDLGNMGTAVGPGPEAGGEGRGDDRNPYVGEILNDAIGSVGGTVQDGAKWDTYAADAPIRQAGSGEERPADRQGRDSEEFAPQDRQEGGDVAESQEPEVPEDSTQQEPANSAGAEEAGEERPRRPGFVETAKATVRTVGKAAGGFAGRMRKGGAEEPASVRSEETARQPGSAGEPTPPQPPRPAEAPAAEERVNREDVARAAGQARQKTEDAEATEDKTRAGRDFSDATLAAVAQNLDHVRGEIDRIGATNREFGPRLDNLATAISVSSRDFRQRRRGRVRVALAMMAAMAVGIGGGVALQSRVEVAPQADPTLGWKDHFWNYYGETLMGCFQRAKKAESGYAECAVKVRGR